MPIIDVFTGNTEDYANNAYCISAAVQDAEIFAQLRPKLLKPFAGADKMFEVVSQLKRLFESNGSRSQAMDVVTVCGLDGLEQRTLAAAAFLLFGGGNGMPAAAPSIAAEGKTFDQLSSNGAGEAPVSNSGPSPSPRPAFGAVTGDAVISVDDSPASDGSAVMISVDDSSASQGSAVDFVSLQAPCDEVVRKLRAAVILIEEESLEDLELSAATSDDAIRANSATIYVVLKSESDFSKIEPFLSGLLTPLPDSSSLMILLRQVHEFSNFVGTTRQSLSHVLKHLSRSSTQNFSHLSDVASALISNVSALFFS
jgi:hypothetical protein